MKILFPPHPNIRIPTRKLSEYEKSGKWVAQRKFNGTNIVINITQDRKIKIFTRHGTAPKLFSLSKSQADQILSLDLDKDKEYWLNGELLDHKTKSKYYKKKIILFDVLWAGKYLISNTQLERLSILEKICRFPKILEPNNLALFITEDIWLAETWMDNFENHYKEFLRFDEIEGLILRKLNSTIDNFGQKEYDVSWMVKCRKPHAGGNYNF